MEHHMHEGNFLQHIKHAANAVANAAGDEQPKAGWREVFDKRRQESHYDQPMIK